MNEISIPVGRGKIAGDFDLPDAARGVVLFAHGSGSSRFSPRNRQVASALQNAGFGTLLMDLLSEEEDRVDRETAEFRFDISLLATRLAGATDWLRAQAHTRDLALGYFGASTGAAAALMAAGQRPDDVASVVSRGGRPDLAGEWLPKVQAPTLLIVGSRDKVVIDLNRGAMEHMQCEKSMEIVPGATHLFEEPGTLEQVAKRATEWFRHYLVRDRHDAA